MSDTHLNPQAPGPLSAAAVIKLLALAPLPREGGYFARTYLAVEKTPRAALPPRYEGDRAWGSAIYYLITHDSYSTLHKLTTDEIFHFYLGDPVEMLQLRPDGTGEVIIIGTDLARGQRPQVVVPHGVWQGSRLMPGGRFGFALLGTTMAPGYDDTDYTHGRQDELLAAYPDFHAQIVELTRR